MSKEVLDTKNCPETKMDSTQRYEDVSKHQQPTMKKVKVPVGDENKALNCTNCKVTCHYPCNSSISTESSCPAFAMEDVGAALESDFVSVSWACKVCPGHCLYGVHKYEDVKWDHVQETMDSMDQQMNEKEITPKKEMEETNQRLDVSEMKVLANDPPTRPENIQEITTTEEDNEMKPGEDEKIKSWCEVTMENSESAEQVGPEIKPLVFKIGLGHLICSGYYRALFRGSFNGKKVAIKRVLAGRTKFQENEDKILCKLSHPNVIQLLQVIQDVHYRFSVFELAAGTVDDFCSRIYRGKMPSDDEALKQMAEGLLYIHGKRFAHLNISPYSVYISTSEPVRLMIAKFGSCEATTDTGTFSIGYYNDCGTGVWMAPEITEYFDYFDGKSNELPVNTFSIASDTWSLGCLFFYFLTRGIHPYGEDDDTIQLNIDKTKNPAMLEDLQASKHEEVYDLIREMIATQPEQRISLETVVMRLKSYDQPNPTAATAGDSSCENKPEMNKIRTVLKKGWKNEIEKTIEIPRLDMMEMKALANDPPTRPENIQEMITIEEDNEKPGEDEKIKSLCEITAKKDNKSTEQIPEMRGPVGVMIDWNDMICSGYYRAIFNGSFNGEKVAIKRVPTDKTQFQEKEENILCKLNHPNVIKLLQVTQDVDYRYYIYELAAGSVDDFCLSIYREKMPSDEEALKQMAEGLLYIHGKRFAHLNISPYSVYISTSEPVRLMIAKFGSCEPTTETGTFSIGCDNKRGETEWMAPEISKYFEQFDGDEEEPINTFSIACDTWSLGCLFFYFLTRGVHPFGEDDDAIRWNIVVKQNPVKLKAMQASKHGKVYDLIREMIDTQPEKRISLETVVMRLKALFPSSVTSHQEPTSGESSCENKPEVEGKLPGVREKDEHRTDKTRLEDEVKCTHCDGKMKEMKDTCEDLQIRLESVEEKLDYLNRSAVRSILKSESGQTRIISSFYQLVKCYSEAKDEGWTEEDVIENCKRVVDHLEAVNSEHNFCLWYYSQAKQQKDLAPEVAMQIKNTPVLSPAGKINWNIVKLYQESGTKLKNYLSGPISNWNNYYEPSGPIFLLALYQSIQEKSDLLSFPPSGIVTMDVPLQISTAISSVHIEVGVIKSTNDEKVMTSTKLQLRRSLLCFKWLDELLSKTKKFSYGLVGNIYIGGNCSTTQEENERKIDDEGSLKEEGIVIYRKYKMY